MWNCPCIHSLSLYRAAQIPFARSPRQLNFVCWCKTLWNPRMELASCHLCVLLPVWKYIQAGLIFCDFFFLSFSLTWLENLHYPSNLHDNFRFNAVWHQWSVTTLIFSRRPAGSDFSATPSVVYGLITLVI
jgi:hypothetical protein